MTTDDPDLPIRIVLVNDYEIVVRGLAQLLEPYESVVQVVQLAANAEAPEPADIALYDTFSQTADAAAFREVMERTRTAKMVVYSWNLSAGLAKAAIEEGADGYLAKQLSVEELVGALVAIHRGETVITEETLSEDAVEGDWPGRSQGLTARESEIIALIAQGLSNQEIADRAYLSINSVKSYIRTAYRKMGVTSRSLAVLWALDHGFRPDHVVIRPADSSRS